MKIVNPTPFAMDRALYLDRRAAEILVIALKCTWNVDEAGALSIADEQALLSPVEKFTGKSGLSSILQEAELGLPKVATDVFLRGSATGSNGARARVVDVA